MRETQAKPRLLVLATALSVALLFAALAVFAAEAQAKETSFSHLPPKAFLMQDFKILQAQSFQGAEWYFYKNGEWLATYWDAFGYYTFPKADVVAPGTELHVRISKPERPNVLINSHQKTTKNGFPIGKREPIKHTFKPVIRNRQTIAWDIVFRLNKPKHNYHLVVYAIWHKKPGSHASYGDVNYAFHVKTTLFPTFK